MSVAVAVPRLSPSRPWRPFRPSQPLRNNPTRKRHTNPESARPVSGTSFEALSEESGAVRAWESRRGWRRLSENQPENARRLCFFSDYRHSSDSHRTCEEVGENRANSVKILRGTWALLSTTSCVRRRVSPLDMGMVNDKTHPAEEAVRSADD